jgi:hypothetical protein
MNNRLHGQMTTIRNLPILWAACLIAFLALPSVASPPGGEEGPKRQEAEAGRTEAVATKAIRVVYDPETGEIISVPFRETEVLSAPLAKALSRSTEGLRVFELANGGKGVHLDGRFQHALMIRVKPDGSLETVCTNHSHEAENFLKGKTAGTKPAPRDK